MFRVITDPAEIEKLHFDLLARNVAAFERMLFMLLKAYPGKWVLMKDEVFIGVHDSAQQAFEAGYRQFGLTGFFAQEIRELRVEDDPLWRGMQEDKARWWREELDRRLPEKHAGRVISCLPCHGVDWSEA